MKTTILALAITGTLVAPFAATAAEDDGNNVSFGGAVELNIGTGGDFKIGTVELGIEGQASDSVTAGIVLLAEEDDAGNGVGQGGNDSFAVDEVVIGVETAMATITMGKTTLPFGSYETNMISDPLTIEGETGSNGAIIAEMAWGDDLNVAVFATTDSESTTGANVSYAMGDLSLGAGTISNGGEGNDTDATTFSLSYTMGDISIIAERVKLSGSDASTNLEIAYDFGNDIAVAIGRSDKGSSEQTIMAVNAGLYDGLSIAVESLDDGSTTTTSAVLAYEF